MGSCIRPGLAFKLRIRISTIGECVRYVLYLMNCQNGNILQLNIFLFMGAGGSDSNTRYGIPKYCTY